MATSRDRVPPDLADLAAELLDGLEAVLHHDWEYTCLQLGIDPPAPGLSAEDFIESRIQRHESTVRDLREIAADPERREAFDCIVRMLPRQGGGATPISMSVEDLEPANWGNLQLLVAAYRKLARSLGRVPVAETPS